MNNKRLFNQRRNSLFTLIFLFFFSFHAFAVELNENITVSFTGIPLSEAIKKIESASNYHFFYDKNKIDITQTVSLNAVNQPIERAIYFMLQNTNLSYEITNKQIALFPKRKIVLKKITGKVVDEHNEPVIGANVVVKGTSTGNTTDLNGEFSLNAAESDVLQITFIGYVKQEVRVGNKTSFNIVLKEDAQSLNEVVVSGYGVQKKVSVTSAIVQIDAKELSTTTHSSLTASLAGRLPGLTVKQSGGAPGADGANLVIRGFGSLNSNDPLIIVDGIAQTYFPNIGNEDIENISVLKDATACAVYGVQGASGVILITTKRGAMQKPTVTLNSSIALNQNTDFPRFLNGPEYAYWYNKAEEMDGIAVENRRFTQDQLDRIINGDKQGIFGSTDWFDLLFKKTAPTYNNTISVNGGNEKIRYYSSLSAYNQRGIVSTTAYDRYTFRMNMDAEITKNFFVEMNAYGNSNQTKGPALDAGQQSGMNNPSALYSQAMLMFPYQKATWDDGVHGVLHTASYTSAKNQSPINGRDESGRMNIKSTTFNGNIGLRWLLPVKGLEAKLRLAYDKSFTIKKSSMLSSYVYRFDLNNESYIYEPAGYASKDKASLSQWYADSSRQTLQATVSYNNKFGKHGVGGLFVYEYTKTGGESMTAARTDFPIRDIMDLNYGETLLEEFGKGGHSYFHRAGYVMRLNYNFDEKYLFEATARLDGTPNFAPDQRWGFFPGVSAGWRMSEESFIKDNVSFINNLKIRASYGLLGNDNIGGKDSYMWMKRAQLATSASAVIGDEFVRKLTMTGVPNEDITWEKSSMFNGGIEATLWNGLLGVEVDAFYMLTYDILQSQSAVFPPSVGGYYPSLINYGKVLNRGVEFTLNHMNQAGKFFYNLRGTLGFSRNKILKTTEDPNYPEQRRLVGHSTGLKYGFVCEGLFQSQEEIDHSAIYEGAVRDQVKPGDAKMKDLNGDGRITMDQDYDIIGRSDVPEMQFSLNFNAEYKGFDLNLYFQGAALCDVALAGMYTDGRGFAAHTFYTRPFFSDGNSPVYLLENSWTPENTNAKYERLSTRSRESGSWMSDFFIRDGAYLRLKNAQIGYTIPKRITMKAGLDKVRLYVSGSNLFTLDHLEGLDPEMPSVNQGYYPQQRIYEFGLNVIF